MINALSSGTELVIKNHKYQVTSIVAGKVYLLDILTDAELIYEKKVIEALIFRDEAKFIHSESKLNKLSAPDSSNLSTVPQKYKNIAKERWEYVNAVLIADIKGLTNKNLANLIDEVSTRLGKKGPNWRTLKRWYDSYHQYGVMGLVPQFAERGNKNSRVRDKVDELIDLSLEELKRSEKVSFVKAYQFFTDSLNKLNRQLDDEEKYKGISYVAYLARARKLNAYDIAVGQYGKDIANKLFKLNKENRVKRSVKYILDRAEIDHTLLDLFVFDSETGLPLGRPWITSVLDMKSKSVLGVYVGFEHPSFVSVGRAIKNAISDKLELLSAYPEVKNEWLCRGIFHVIAVDRGKEFMSNLLDDALFELGVVVDRNPVRKPWYKGSIESHFNTINKTLLSNLPGKVFSELADKRNYDPAKNGCISFKAFLRILYLWIVDEYQAGKSSSYNAPNLVWREDEPSVDSRPISNTKLNLIFAENKQPQNGKKGIRINHIQYDSRDLKRIRHRDGLIKVNVKYDRENINVIHVWDKVNEIYIKVHSLNPSYTKGLTLYQHLTILKYHRKHVDENIDADALVDTRQKIKDIVLEELANRKKHKKSSTMSRAARYGNVSSHPGGETSLKQSMVNQEANMNSEDSFDKNILDGVLNQEVIDDGVDDIDFE